MSATLVRVATSGECLRSEGRYGSCEWQVKVCDPLASGYRAISERFRDVVYVEALYKSTFFTFSLSLLYECSV